MPLTLRDGHYFVRATIGELEQFRWSDAFINFSLNNRAQEFLSAGGSTTQYTNVPLGQGIYGQEGPLPIDVDQVKAVKWYAGQLYPLEYRDWDIIQSGSFTGSIPFWFYIKTDVTQLTPQTISSNIVETDLTPALPQGYNYRQVIGVWPQPSAAGELQVFHSAYHPLMTEPQSISPIPKMFLDGWAAGTIADCLRIEKAYEESAYWDAQFLKRKEDYRIYSYTHRQVSRPMRYGAPEAPWRTSASSSIILVDQTPRF